MMMNEVPHNLKALNRIEILNASTLEVKKRLRRFDEFAHKGIRGHAAIFAGSEGMMGAAILATSACMKSGAGKTTAFVPASYFPLIHQTVPEALVSSSDIIPVSLNNFQSIAIGPGLGISHHSKSLLEFAIHSNKPMVIDADALNILAQNKLYQLRPTQNALLTPHHGEWERLFKKCDDDFVKINTSIEFCKKLNTNMILKGHYSILVTPNFFFINGTGNSGMAKAGSGDVLTGLLASLLAQGYEIEDAAVIGMYLHGLAGDLAKDQLGEDCMIASDLIHYLSDAFRSVRN